MLFSSISFLFYFLPMVLLLYYLLWFSKPLKNTVLLVASLFFYAWGEPWFVGIMILSIVMNYVFGILVDKYREKRKRVKGILIGMCVYNLGMLFVFKYLTFILRHLNEYKEDFVIVPNIMLPIGISFFTFQAISYVVDVYQKKGKVQKNPFNVGLYIAFFPQLIAGPIVRYNVIAEQIHARKETWGKFSVGVCRFIVGLSKKILISNNMAIVTDQIFVLSGQGNMAVSLAWLGSIAYTLQIYFDFSGYSDMAIGLGLMFGFKFEENFNYPYISKSISEFWRRWHISLGSWFKDYVYFPMGGSRVTNKDKMVKNLFVVWLLTGIWHGAEWTFVVWGMLHFACIVGEKFINFEKWEGNNWLKTGYVLFVVNIGWVIFRAPNLKEAGHYLGAMFGFIDHALWSDYTFMFLKEYGIFFLIGIIFSMPIGRRINKRLAEKPKGGKIVEAFYPVVILLLFFICITYLVKGTYNPFIYFNF